MIMGLLILSILFGGACGITAFGSGFGLIQSLIVYAVAGQIPFIVVPLIILMIQYLSEFFPTELGRSSQTQTSLLRNITKN